MASFGGLDLGLLGYAVFELTSETDDWEFVHTLPDGSEVILPASSWYVAVRAIPGASFDEVHAMGREAANRGIDIYFGTGGRPHHIAHKNEPYLVGWHSQLGRALRVVGRDQITSRFRASGHTPGGVRDASGNLVSQPPAPPKVWHQSLRYYRAAEASIDLYDSFRNLYLAIESLLSKVDPPTRPGDSNWLRRALGVAAARIDLRPFGPATQTGPPVAIHEAIHQEIYRDLRTAIFHAKDQMPTWLPQDWASRPGIVEARSRYAQMFRALATEYLGISYPAGGWAQAPWENTWEGVLSDHEIYVSNDPTQLADEPKGQYQVAPAGGDHLMLPTAPAVDLASDWRRGVIGTEAAQTVHESVGGIRRFGTLRADEPMSAYTLRAPLVVDGIDVLQVVVLVEGRNYGQPRQDFES
jgi:hypothetical protein